jgi:hypothetical protein
MAELVLDIRHQDGLHGRPLLDELIARAERLNSGPLDDDVALALLNHIPGETGR